MRKSTLQIYIMIALTALVFALLQPANAQGWGDTFDKPSTRLGTLRSPGANANIRSNDMGGGFGRRSGTINGKPFHSNTIDMGNGFKTESGTIGNRSFHCTTTTLPGGYSSTNCN